MAYLQTAAGALMVQQISPSAAGILFEGTAGINGPVLAERQKALNTPFAAARFLAPILALAKQGLVRLTGSYSGSRGLVPDVRGAVISGVADEYVRV